LLINNDNITPNYAISSLNDVSISQRSPFQVTAGNSTLRSKRFAKNIDEFVVDEPYALPLRPIVRGPFEADEPNLNEVSVIYVEPHSKILLNCEVDLDVQSAVWLKDGQVVQMVEVDRAMGSRYIKEPRGSITINNVMLEDDGFWQCEAENFRGYMETGRATKLVVLIAPRPPYLLFETRRLDASNLFIPVKESAEISLSCVSEGGNPKPLLSWEILLNPSVDHHAMKLPPDSLEVQVVKTKEKDKDYKINSGAKSDAKLPYIYRAHHNARVLCVMEHPSLKIRQNASIVLDVQCRCQISEFLALLPPMTLF
jgi:Immunoglobulin domain/CD80-like C2-set immunoglobulin domain